MFPIPKSETSPFIKKDIHTYRSFNSDIEKSKYIHLLDIELKSINTMNLDQRAKNLYQLKYNNPNHVVSKRCIDFKEMERLAKQYLSVQNNN